MANEAGAECPQRGGDAVAQAIAGANAGFVPGVAPAFQRAIRGHRRRTLIPGRSPGGRGKRFAEAARVGDQPEGREVGVEVLGEDRLQIDVDIRRAGQAGVGAQDAQAESIGDDGPEAAIGGVQNLLRQQERRPAAQALGGPVAEALMRAVEVLRMRGEHQRHTTPKRVEADRESAFADHDLTDRLQIGEAEHLPAEWDKEFLDRESMRVEVGALATDLEIAPEVLRDLPVTADLVAQLQSLGNIVVHFGLLGAIGFLQLREARELVRGQEPAFDAQSREGKFGGVAPDHSAIFRGRWASGGEKELHGFRGPRGNTGTEEIRILGPDRAVELQCCGDSRPVIFVTPREPAPLGAQSESPP